MKAKLLYINDYACSPDVIEYCQKGNYPRSHLWGVFDYLLTHRGGIKWHCARKSLKYPRIQHLWEIFKIFVKYWNVDIVYSALPGYELLFLLVKKLRLKKYKIVTVVHHPCQRLHMLPAYDRLIFISKKAYEKYQDKDNTEYIFWGPDMDFYLQKADEIEYDLVAAGKTHRDYNLMKSQCNKFNVKYIIFGDKSQIKNEISYVDLLNIYCKSKFVCMPLSNINLDGKLLIGLTSFVDAMALGLPVLISDNSEIGIDIEELNLGLVYKAGDEKDFASKLKTLISMSDNDYNEMSKSCHEFAVHNSFSIFSRKVNAMLESV